MFKQSTMIRISFLIALMTLTGVFSTVNATSPVSKSNAAKTVESKDLIKTTHDPSRSVNPLPSQQPPSIETKMPSSLPTMTTREPARNLAGDCPWGTTGTFSTAVDCTQNSEISVSGHLILKGVENANPLVKVTRSGGSSTQKRFFKLGHATQPRSLDISWLHFTGGRKISYKGAHGYHGSYIQNNAAFVLGVGSHYSLILRDSEVSDMIAQHSGCIRFSQKVAWSNGALSTDLRFESRRTKWHHNKADMSPIGSLHTGHVQPATKGPKMDQEKDCQPESTVVIIDSSFEFNVAPYNYFKSNVDPHAYPPVGIPGNAGISGKGYYPYSNAGITLNGPFQSEIHGSKFLNNLGGWVNEQNNVSTIFLTFLFIHSLHCL